VHRALSFSSAGDDHYAAPSARTGIGIHLDAVYGFALTLTGDAHSAEELTEGVFECAHDDLWTTLGGHGLRDRLLARCVTAFRATFPTRRVGQSMTTYRISSRDGALSALLLGLPWDERAAIALVDQLGLTYAAGAAVLGTEVAEFRALLHQGRSVLFAAYRTGAR
jgi:DNA-directed RNA polymerase specialized sigma24 family protein